MSCEAGTLVNELWPLIMNLVRLRGIEDARRLEVTAQAWGHVAAQSHTRSPFTTHAFVRHWWSSFGSPQRLRVLIAEDANGPCAIAPLACARRSLGPLVYRSLELIGTGALWGRAPA
jgi:hypothetical protein